MTRPVTAVRGLAPAFAFLLLSSAALHAQQQAPTDGLYDLGIEEHIFDNGLRLLVLERPGDPRVAAKIFTDFGAIVEEPGELGSAHFLEHLMFKGTRTLGTVDWESEAPLREAIREAEHARIEELNRARNALRQRGVFHEYAHSESTPTLDSLDAVIRELEAQAKAYYDNGSTMRWYQAYGGTGLTATTEQEYMKFDINLPANRVDLFLRVEADRMKNTQFREFDEEVMILVEQRLGDLNRPTTPFYEAMSAAVGTVHPVFWPEGYLTDFEQYTRAYQRDLYERYYVPNNTTLVFVGGVSLADMIPKVDRWFGHMERGPEPMRTKAIEPPPAAERRIIWRADDLSPRIDVRHQIPGVGHPDRPRIDVLGEVLRMEVVDQLAAGGVRGTVDVNTRVIHTSRFGIPGSVNVEVVTGNAATLPAAERAILRALTRMRNGVIRPDRVELAKKRLRVAWHRTAANADALAFEIGHFQTMDRWQTLEEFLNGRESTTVQDLQRVADKYFIVDNRTTGTVIPEAGE